jgi:hypothetical protein
LSQAKDELEKLWNAEGRPGKDGSQWARGEASKDIGQLKNNLTQIGNIDAAFQNMQTALGPIDRALSEQMKAEKDPADAEAKQKDGETRLLRACRCRKGRIMRIYVPMPSRRPEKIFRHC